MNRLIFHGICAALFLFITENMFADSTDFRLPRARVVLSAGGALRLKPTGALDKNPYNTALNRGFVARCESGYFYSRRNGAGFIINVGLSGATTSSFKPDNSGNYRLHEQKDRITTAYIGPAFMQRHVHGNSSSVSNTSFSFGIMRLNWFRQDEEVKKFTGLSPAFCFLYSLDLTASQSTGVTLSAGIHYGFLQKGHMNDSRGYRDYQLEDAYSITRVELAVGIHLLH